MKIYDLRIEYEKNPFGISVEHPRFSWKIDSNERNTMQQLYNVRVSKIDGDEEVWNTGNVESEQSAHIEYNGRNLEPETLYKVEVNVIDNHNEEDYITGSFETGIFDPLGFRAQMITHDFSEDSTNCPVFYKEFEIDKNIKKAYAYVTCYGVYEMTINGKTIGDFGCICFFSS